MPAPETALQAVRRSRLPVSRWPWRSAWYLLTTVVVAVPAVAVLAVPWVVLLVQLGAGRVQPGMAVLLTLLTVGLVGALGPLIAPPLARIERRRMRLVDRRPAHLDPPVPVDGGPLARLRADYAHARTWRAVGYVYLLATVAPPAALAALFTVALALTFVASPVLVAAQGPGSAPVALGFGSASTIGQTVPYVVGGVLLLAAAPYLLTLLAAGQAALARALLFDGADERLRTELVEVARSRARLVGAFDSERRRIERDLHDGAQQKLVSLTMRLGLARLELADDSPAAQNLSVAVDQAKQLMSDLRNLVHGIRPQTLADYGLPAALEELAAQSPVPVTVRVAVLDRPPGAVENTAYFVAAEALANVAKHADAGRAMLTARRDGPCLILEITDDGRGGGDPARGTGLTGLADRVAAVGGRLLLSSPDGGPTLLRVELPWTNDQPPSE